MIVGDAYVGRSLFDIKGTVTFCLVGIASGLSIEEIIVMDPDVAIIRVDGNRIVRKHGKPQIPDFHIPGPPEQNPPTVGIGVLTDAFDCEVHFLIIFASFDFYVAVAVNLSGHVLFCDLADDSDHKGRFVMALLS